MKLRIVTVAAALFLSACASVADTDQRAGLQLVDLTDEFAHEFDRTQNLPDPERVSAFKSRFATLLPGFYSHERFRLPDATKYDQRFLEGLKTFPELRAGIAEISRRFTAMLEPAREGFEAQFGRMEGYPPIYLVNSLGEFDGGTRSLPEGTRLVFGADMIARLHGDHDIRPFFHHELFHLYHHRTFSGCEPVWCDLWTEGLATYVASRLNPKATDAELLLTSPEPLRSAVEKDRSHAVCAVAARLQSTSPDDYRALFSNGRLDERLPGRFGYYVGYLVAAEAGKTRSLQELANLGPNDVLPLIRAELAGLARCPT